MAEAILQRLRELGEEYNLRDPRKLLQIAQRQGVAGATAALAKEALALDVGRQIIRPPPRATGRAAAPSKQISVIFRTTCPQPRRAIATP